MNIKAAIVFHSAGTQFSTTSTSFVDLLSQIGGSTISISIVKASGSTNLLVLGSTACLGGPETVTLAVNDGTTDTNIAQNRTRTQCNTPVVGEVLVTGLAAGTYTMKLRVKTAAGSSVGWTLNAVSSSISVMEVAP